MDCSSVTHWWPPSRCAGRRLSQGWHKTLYEDAHEHAGGRWRKVVDDVVACSLGCDVLDAGFARVRCPECRAENLLAFTCKGRYCCPSWHAKRLWYLTPVHDYRAVR
jgi:hypothetical protein